MTRLIITAIFLLSALGIGFFYGMPEWELYKTLSAEIAQLEVASKELDALVANRDNLLNLINGITKEDLDRVDQVLPQGARASDFLVAVEALTGASGMGLGRIDLVSPPKAPAVAAGNPAADLPQSSLRGAEGGAAILAAAREGPGA